ncbi:MAG: hypothetical protein AAGD28_16750, partial [Bacteroidota bacterium]
GLNLKINKSKTTHVISLNVQNVTNRLNEYSRRSFYDPIAQEVQTTISRQSGLIPVLKYAVNF